jgi:fermentation-respiration switch protein FrsA (DUF1100 family)
MIFVFGRSLGGAVAIELCMQPDSGIRGLILENTFTSISDMASTMVPVPYSTIFKWFLQKIHYPSIKRIRKVKQPILFIRGMQDEIVPVKFMQRLHDKAKACKFKEQYDCFEGEHNNTYEIGGNEYIKRFTNFM